jgi:hypothetical protein
VERFSAWARFLLLVAMTNAEVHDWYNAQVSTIPKQNQAWLGEGLSAER